MSVVRSGTETYRRLLTFSKPHLVLFFFGVVATIIMSATDATFTWLVKPIINRGFVDHDSMFLRWLPFLVFIVFIIRAASGLASSYFMARVARAVIRDLRRAIFAKLLRVPARFYDTHGSGYILSTIIYNVEQVAQACSDAVLTCVRESALLAGLIVVIFLANWQFACLFLIIAPAIAVIVKRSSFRMRRLSKNVQSSVGDLTHIAGEAINGYRIVRLYGGGQYETNKFDAVTNQNFQRELKIVITNGMGSTMVQMLLFIPIVIALTCSTSALLHFSAGSVVSVMTAMFALLRPVKRIGAVNTEIQKGVAAAESIFKVLDEAVENDSGEQSVARVKGSVEFRNVTFEYPASTHAVLKNISFSVEAGKTVAFVGKSGSGKSTLLNLLPRFYEVQQGEITIDGININALSLLDLRRQLGFVSQDTILFDDTVGNNIAYGSTGTVSEADLLRVAHASHAFEFISQLPDGFNTKIGEDGVMLSGGQRQRIAIARALLKDAPILILDEATASLDTHAERHIQKALEDLMKNRTVLVVAHRLSTIINADCIFVMEAGDIVETGTHQSLLAKEGVYAALYRAQFQE